MSTKVSAGVPAGDPFSRPAIFRTIVAGMSAKLTRSSPVGSRQLLARILEEPNLVAAVQSLPAPALGKLINHVGLEDAGEIVALATTEQLRGIFDDDLWRSERPGQDEAFDADRFGRWLEIMLEAGEAFTAQRLVELPEDLVTLALSKHVLVINIEEMAVAMSGRQSDEDALLEKALESCLGEEIGEYRIIALRHDGWDAVLSVLLALDRDHHAYLERLLERCCYLAAEHIEENGGLYHVLTFGEMLEGDAAAEREDRRAAAGYLSPSSAASFLALARGTELDAIVKSRDRDPITRAYFRAFVPDAAVARSAAEPAADSAAGLVRLMREAEVLPPARLHGLLGSAPRAASAVGRDLLAEAMRRLAEESPAQHAHRMEELAYLANVLVAGCSWEGRAFRPAQAATAVLATCKLGIEHFQASSARAVDELLARGADWLFRIGWRLLGLEVAAPAAGAIAGLLARGQANGADLTAARELARLRAGLSSDKPWTTRARLAGRAELGAPATAAALLALIDECPHLAGCLLEREAGLEPGPGSVGLLATREQLGKVTAFLAGLPR